MSWIVTADGHEVDLRHPSAGALTLQGIAHSLSQINRFTGHCARPYSVAEHSLLVCEILERTITVDVHGRLAGLMHDAHESLTGDLHSPGKIEVGEAWQAFEGNLQRHVLGAFALLGPMHVWHSAIKRADLIALATERTQLLPHRDGMRTWQVMATVAPIDWVDLMDPGRCQMTWRDWREAFIDKHNELDFERTDSLFPNHRADPPTPHP